MRHWLYVCAGMVVLMILIGGITRLSGSGLSMTSWHPITGILPPLSHAQWLDAFAIYQQYPEYQLVNRAMSLAEFQLIYLVEYGHRMWGRLLGLVFLLPFLFFLTKNMLTKREYVLLSCTLALGALQAWVGWWMVQSGLIHEPQVSHLRLALHFSLALTILSLLLLTARPCTRPPAVLITLTLLVFITMVAGSFVAGLHGGTIYNTFPLMNGAFLPHDAFALTPLWLNLKENPVLWQWLHRMIATVTLLWAWYGVWKLHHPLVVTTAIIVTLQWSLGVATVLLSAMPSLAIIHQAGGVAAFTLALWTMTHENHRAP